LDDAKKTVELKPDWTKGYSRLGAANVGLGQLDEAVTSYKKGLDIDPNNEQISSALKDVEKQIMGTADGMGNMFDMFKGPEIWGKIASNPSTAPYLNQPDFVQMLQTVQSNPSTVQNYLQDPRMMNVFGMMLGVNVMSGEQAASQFGQDSAESAPPQKEGGGCGNASCGASCGANSSAAPTPPPPAAEAEPKPAAPEPTLTKEESEEKEAKEKAQAEKQAGNAAYKKKEFEKALEHYTKAMEIDAKDISYMTNRAAVYFEMGKFDECIKDCDDAIEKGPALRVDYKMIARALTRKGNALRKKGDLELAIKTYKKSLTEHRNADTLKRLNEVEKELKDTKEEEYISLDICTEEKDKGNAFFKESKFPEAVKCYTEALKRGPPKVNEEAHKLYSNRSACYTKLGALPEAVKDAECCIELSPAFAKGYSRKGTAQFFMKDYDKAMETYKLGLEQDSSNEELKAGLQRCIQKINMGNSGMLSEEEQKERQAHAMADPEVQGILSDPIMRQVLQDFQENPKAAQEHMKDPNVMAKVQKLVNAGVVQVR
jgi:stress-induced-phosphoprotein 1